MQKWKLEKPDWMNQLRYEDLCDADDTSLTFVSMLITMAVETMSKTSKNPREVCFPWFDESCKTALAECKEAQKMIYSNLMLENLELGIPQRRILSVTHFILKPSTVAKYLPPGIRCS